MERNHTGHIKTDNVEHKVDIAYLQRLAKPPLHYSDVIMGTMAYQATSITIFTQPFIQGADQRKHQNSVSLATEPLWGKFTGDRWIPRTKGQ